MFKQVLKHIHQFSLAYLIGFAVILRLILLFGYQGYSLFPDSSGYIELADYLSGLNLDNYPGKRTPGYPALIALLGGNLKLITLVQMLFGVLNTYLLYQLILLKTSHKPLAFWTSVFFTSLLHVQFFEVVILTETLTLTLVLLVFWMIKKHNIFNATISLTHLIVLSTLLGYCYLVRPMFIYLPLWFSMVYMYKNIRVNYKKAFVKSILVLTLPILTFYSWSSLNEKNIGVFGSTYFMGINLTQNATSFFEKAPNKDALIRDIFVKHRDSIVRYGKTREYPMSIWFAYDELLEKTQLQPHELSAELGRISKNLFLEHPTLYLKQVGVSWRLFWGDSVLWKPNQLKSTLLKKVYMGSWEYFQKWISLLLKIVFLLISIKHIYVFIKNGLKVFDFELFIISTILLGSFAQALVTFGSNARFSFPYLPLIIYIVAINIKPYLKRYVEHP